MEKEQSGFFPIFISMKDAKVLIVGGGKIALRRIRTLLSFGAALTVIAPEVLPEIACLPVQTICRKAAEKDVSPDYRLVVAASSDRETNRQIGLRATALGIPVSVADAKEESTFYFPAIIQGEGITAGLISENGQNHHLAAEKAALLRAALHEHQ